jgi:hypothetical protein
MTREGRILVEVGRRPDAVTSAVIAGWAIANWTAAARSGTSWRAQTSPIRVARSTTSGGAGV